MNFLLAQHVTKKLLLSLTIGVVLLLAGNFLVSPELAEAGNGSMTSGMNGSVAGDPVVVEEAKTNFFTQITWDITTWIGGYVVRTGGYLLDTSISTLVIEMGALMAGDFGVAVNSVWVVIRDTFNLLFIFALIYIGLRIIWDAGDGGAKRNLARLIVAALLINFSLFFAKVIVDMGNIAAIQIYSLYANLQAVTSTGIADATSQGIAAYVLHHFGLGAIGSQAAIATPNTITMGYAMMVFLFLLVTGFVFAAGAFMIVGRFVLLTIYMMFAPFMFIGLIIPNFGSYQTRWWGGFLKQVFVAPAFLFTTYIALRVMTVAQGQPGFTGDFVTELSAPNTTDGPGTLVIVVGLGFMILALTLANKMGAVGAATSIKVGQNIRQRGQRLAGAATAGMAARAGRATLGRYGASTTDNDSERGRRLNQLAVNGNWAQRTYARGVQGAGQKMATTSYDVRQAAGIGTALGVGDGKKGGYQANADADNKARQQRTLRANEAQKIEEATAAAENLGDLSLSAADVEANLAVLARSLRSMSKDTKNGLGYENLNNVHVAGQLSDADLDNLRDSGNYSQQQIASIRATRDTARLNTAQYGFAQTQVNSMGNTEAANTQIASGAAPDTEANMRERLVRGGVTAAGNLPAAVFQQQSMYEFITPQMVEERMKNGVTAAELDNIATAVRSHLGLPQPGTGPSLPPSASTVAGKQAWQNWYERSRYGSRIFG